MDDRSELVAVLGRIQERGARAGEVLRVRSAARAQGEPREPAAHRSSVVWTVRVWRDGGRSGVASGSDPRAVADAALESSVAAPLDPMAGPAERMPVRAGALGIDDPRHAHIADADRAEIHALAQKSCARGGLRLTGYRYAERRDVRAWMNTRGAEAAEAATTYSVEGTVQAGEQAVSHRLASRHFADVASVPFGVDLARRAEALLRRAPPPDRALPVVLEPRVVAELVRALAPAFAAPGIAGSFLAPYLGRALAPSSLHLTDDAGRFAGLQSCAFDDRGVPPIAVTLLKEGVVNALYHDPESARAAGLRPTGHVRDGAVRPSNLIVRPGARTRNLILAELGQHLLLDRLPALDGGTGRLTGSVPVVRVERGERVGAFEARIDIGVVELLGALVELAADPERVGEVDAPTAVLGSLRFA